MLYLLWWVVVPFWNGNPHMLFLQTAQAANCTSSANYVNWQCYFGFWEFKVKFIGCLPSSPPPRYFKKLGGWFNLVDYNIKKHNTNLHIFSYLFSLSFYYFFTNYLIFLFKLIFFISFFWHSFILEVKFFLA